LWLTYREKAFVAPDLLQFYEGGDLDKLQNPMSIYSHNRNISVLIQ